MFFKKYTKNLKTVIAQKLYVVCEDKRLKMWNIEVKISWNDFFNAQCDCYGYFFGSRTLYFQC